MKLLVFADTHNSSSRMPAVLEKEGMPDACIFLGDGARDADKLQELYPRLRLYRVAGNCDYDSFDPHEGLAVFGGVLFFYTHGDTYHVKLSTAPLLHAAKVNGAAVALFGHTHVPHHEVQDGVHLFNPGSLSIPRGSTGPTYGIVNIAGAQPHFSVCPYSGT